MTIACVALGIKGEQFKKHTFMLKVKKETYITKWGWSSCDYKNNCIKVLHLVLKWCVNIQENILPNKK
jgi:hypothetical protein